METYLFNAAWYCEDCIAKSHGNDYTEPEGPFDSGDFPAGPYSDGGGESDTPEHCDSCGVFLENDLTDDGYEYVEALILEDSPTAHVDSRQVLRVWAEYYDLTHLLTA